MPRSASCLILASSTLLAGLSAIGVDSTPTAKASASRTLFERRILPIFNSKNPSTCSESHLSGVDLKSYIRPSEAGTFAALRQQGLIDIKSPENSHILRLIQMSRPNTPLVTRQTRTAEYTAFRDWI